jgi:hypothetical protein
METVNIFYVKKVVGNSNLYGSGVIMPSGKVVVEWSGDIRTIVIYNSYTEFQVLNKNGVVSNADQ